MAGRVLFSTGSHTVVVNFIPHLIAMLPQGQHESVVERAAICEYDGKMTREEADKAAWEEFTKVAKK